MPGSLCLYALSTFLLCFRWRPYFSPQAFSQDTIRRHYEAAEAHKRAGNGAAAESEFIAILAEGYDRLGNIYLAQKAYEKAVTALEAAALSRPEAPESLINLAVAYFKAGQFEKAFEPLRRELAAIRQRKRAPHAGKDVFHARRVRQGRG